MLTTGIDENNPSRASSVPSSKRSDVSKKAEQYLKDIKKPNIHIAIYYLGLCKEYSLPINFNVLISKDKYRGFKKQIYTTNYRYPEKDLLIKENLRQTLRLILANRFKEDEVATQLVKDIYSRCPTLFATVLLRSEQTSASIASDNEDDELDSIVSDSRYVNPTAVGGINTKFVRSLGLPTRASYLSSLLRFAVVLTVVYSRKYDILAIIMFSRLFVQSKKVAFYYLPT